MPNWGAKLKKRAAAIVNNLAAPQIRDEFEDRSGPIKIHLKHQKSIRPPVLFVPGAFCGAWIWRGTFVEYFHAAGYEVAAMSFGGFNKGTKPRWRQSLNDYEVDLEIALSKFARPPIVIAHSLGGLIAQKVANRIPIAALGLLAPIPLDGAAKSMIALAQQSPISLVKLGAVALEPRLAQLGDAPIGLYSSRVNAEARMAFSQRLQAESIVALAEAFFQRPVHHEKPPCPTHFWGAEGDHIIPAFEVTRAAKDMGVGSTIYPGMSHTLQSEPNWKDVADDVLKWMKKFP